MSASRSLAVAWFALRTNLRSAMSLGGLVAMAAIGALGPIGSWTSGDGWALEPGLLFYGYLTGALFVVRSGLEQQRESGLLTYLRHNFATPLEHGFGLVVSLLGSWLLLTGLLLLLGLVYSGGDAGAAAWYAWVYALAIAVLLPFVIAVEAAATFRMPMVIPVLGYLALAILLSIAFGQQRMVEVLGFAADRADPASSLRLAARAGAVLPLGFGIFLAATWARGRRVPSRS